MSNQDDKYLQDVTALADASRTLIVLTDAIDVAQLRDQCEQAQALAPLIDPTAYMRGGMTNLRAQIAFLAAVERFVTEVRKLDRRKEGADRG